MAAPCSIRFCKLFDHFAFTSIDSAQFERLPEAEPDRQEPGQGHHARKSTRGCTRRASRHSRRPPTFGTFDAVDAARMAWLGRPQPGPIAIDHRRMDHPGMGALPRRHAGHAQAGATGAARRRLHFTGTPNGEIAMRWYPLAERSGYAAARPAIAQFLERMGRRKLIMPVYRRWSRRPTAWPSPSEVFAGAAGLSPDHHRFGRGRDRRAKDKAASTAAPFKPAAPRQPRRPTARRRR